jgi:phospholipid/cholesterol/gamma-HCH transport system substrate-binding protein
VKKFDIELTAGLFMLAGILCLSYISIRLGKMDFFGSNEYEITADFSNIGGLRVGSSIVIAGVDIGRVKSITLNDYEARVAMRIERGVRLQADSIASIKTRGLIGEKYVEITPGGSDKMISPGERIKETEPAVDLESLLAKYVFGNV